VTCIGLLCSNGALHVSCCHRTISIILFLAAKPDSIRAGHLKHLPTSGIGLL